MAVILEKAHMVCRLMYDRHLRGIPEGLSCPKKHGLIFRIAHPYYSQLPLHSSPTV